MLRSVTQIGAISENGIVLQLEYRKVAYAAHTVLKIPINETSDNTLYEALVGVFLNEQSLRYPSFLETYGLYNLAGVDCFKELIEINVKLTKINGAFDFLKQTFTGDDISDFLYTLEKETPAINSLEYYIKKLKIDKLRNNNTKNIIQIEEIKKKLVTKKTDILPKILECMKTGNIRNTFINLSQINNKPTINDACKNPTNYAVLIQHLKGVNTLWDMLPNSEFVENDLLYILFQVYMTLSSLSKVFTHYDLHAGNVLVYEPVVGSYIEYHYHIGMDHIGMETITFKSRYIAKIIDYGACYFSPGFNPLSYEGCKSTKSLKSFMSDNEYKRNSAERNMSHDLRLIHILKTGFDKYRRDESPIWIKQMPSIIFGQDMDEGYEEFGTEENTTVGYPNFINNVTDAYSYLKDTVTKDSQIESNKTHYDGMNKLGDLDIFDNGDPMNYVPVSKSPTTVSEPVTVPFPV